MEAAKMRTTNRKRKKNKRKWSRIINLLLSNEWFSTPIPPLRGRRTRPRPPQRTMLVLAEAVHLDHFLIQGILSVAPHETSPPFPA
jgi:hypothetical protein